MPVRVTAEQYQEKHNRRTKAALEDMRTGINKVSDSPTAKAAAKGDKMLAGIQQAVSSGKWGNRLRAVTLEQWKRAALDKGLPRVSAGLDASSANIIAMARQLLEYENTQLEKISKMPDLTLEDSISRMTTWARGMAQFKLAE